MPAAFLLLVVAAGGGTGPADARGGGTVWVLRVAGFHGWFGARLPVAGGVVVRGLAAALPFDGIADVAGLEPFGA